MMNEFTLKFGSLTIQQYSGLVGSSDRTWIRGSMHRLTPEQFDAMTAAFEVVEEVKTLTTEPTTSCAPRTFRTAEIDFGGLTLTIFADVAEKAVAA